MSSLTASGWWSNIKNKDEYTTPVLIISVAVLLITWYKWVIKNSRNNKAPLPPGPRGLPIVGNLPFIDPDLPIYFHKLSKTYGPIMKLYLGSKLIIVINSPALAKEIFKDNDIIFSNRDTPVAAFAATYGGVDMVWSPYGAHFLMLRKVCVKELLSNVRLEALYGLRKREVRDVVNQIYSKVGQPLDLGECVAIVMFDLITSMLWGGTLGKEERKHITVEFHQILNELVKILSQINVSDLFPALAVLDLQGVERKMNKILLWFDRIFDSVISQREKNKEEGKESEKDFLQLLLQSVNQQDQKTPFTLTHLKALFMDMMVAGTRTSSTTVEWAMAELMNNPKIMKKVQEELEEVVGMDNIVEESHLPKLSYLNAVIRETLRLHPVAPLLVPRSPSESCVVGGYMIPKGAQVLVNAWAIQRDPKSWDNPLEFTPERFLDSGGLGDYKGSNFSFIPFGSGRRICVGLPLAERMIPYMLASLLHSFDWKLPEGTELELSETFGIELKKTIPLVAIPIPRLSESMLYA